jgi:hypothetical protein
MVDLLPSCESRECFLNVLTEESSKGKTHLIGCVSGEVTALDLQRTPPVNCATIDLQCRESLMRQGLVVLSQRRNC